MTTVPEVAEKAASASVPNPVSAPPDRRQWLWTGVVFFLAFCVLLVIQGRLFLPSLDEGLNLEGAARLVGGQRPYVDFFGHASPGAYLYQGLIFRVLGQSAWTGRILVIFYQSVQIAFLFWMVARFSSMRAAWTATWIYTVIETVDPALLSAHHRWDSATLSLVSIGIALEATSGKRGWIWWALSGLTAIAAVMATPTAGLMLGATAIWLLVTKRFEAFAAFAAAATAGAVAVGAWLVATGTLTGGRFGGYLGFLQFMKANYTEANATHYGFVQGGWSGLLADAGFAEMLIRIQLMLCVALPVWVPLAALALWSWRSAGTPRSTAWYLVGCQVAMVLYAFPRPDLQHVQFAAAFAFALGAIWVANQLPLKASTWIAMFFIIWSLAFLYRRADTNLDAKPMDTPIGTVMACGLHRPDIKMLLENVHPGDTMFVYPFMPTLTFLTKARNPTAFPFVQPGMMKEPEAKALLDDLQRTRPHWIIWFPWTRQHFLKIFPGAVNLPDHFPEVQAWVEANYVKKAWASGLEFDLLELRTSPDQKAPDLTAVDKPAIKLP